MPSVSIPKPVDQMTVTDFHFVIYDVGPPLLVLGGIFLLSLGGFVVMRRWRRRSP
jgi:LPXTG-motif cell wall-anchored protein